MADLKLPNLNKAQLSGRITRDIELKHTPKGMAVVSFSIAMDEGYKDQSGQWQKKTTFIDCVAFDKVAEQVNIQARKGMSVIVEGKLTIKKYTDKSEVERTVLEIHVFSFNALEWLPKADDGTQQTPPAPRQPVANDDVPF